MKMDKELTVKMQKTELLAALAKEGIEQRYNATVCFFRKYGVEIVEDESATEAQQMESVQIQPSVLFTEEELISRLKSAEEPKIFVPLEKRELAPGSVDDAIQKCGLRSQFNRSCEFLLRFEFELEMKGLLPNTTRQFIRHCSRFLAFAFKELDIETDKINSIDNVVRCILERNLLAEFRKKLKNCQMKTSSLGTTTTSLNALMNFLINTSQYALSEKVKKEIAAKRDKLARHIGVLKRRVAIPKKSVVNNVEKRASFADIRAMFNFESTLHQVEECIKKYDVPNPAIEKRDFDFFTRFCMSILAIYYGKRLQVGREMLVREWANRKQNDTNGSVTIEVNNVSQGPEVVYLTKEQAKYFEMYFEKFRQAIHRVDEPMTSAEKFFIQYDTTDQSGNLSRIIATFQAEVGFMPVLMHRAIRNIIQTAAYEQFQGDAKKKCAVDKMLASMGLIKFKCFEEIIKSLTGDDCARAMDELEIAERRKYPSQKLSSATTTFQKWMQFLKKNDLEKIHVNSSIPTFHMIEKQSFFDASISQAERKKKAKKLHLELLRQQQEVRKSYIQTEVIEKYFRLDKDAGQQRKADEVHGLLELDNELMKLINDVLHDKEWMTFRVVEMRILPQVRKAVLEYKKSCGKKENGDPSGVRSRSAETASAPKRPRLDEVLVDTPQGEEADADQETGKGSSTESRNAAGITAPDRHQEAVASRYGKQDGASVFAIDDETGEMYLTGSLVRNRPFRSPVEATAEAVNAKSPERATASASKDHSPTLMTEVHSQSELVISSVRSIKSSLLPMGQSNPSTAIKSESVGPDFLTPKPDDSDSQSRDLGRQDCTDLRPSGISSAKPAWSVKEEPIDKKSCDLRS